MKEIMYSYVKGKGWVAAYEIPYTKFARQAAKPLNFGWPQPGDYITLGYGQWTLTTRR